MKTPSKLLALSILGFLLTSPAMAQDEAAVAEQERLQKELQTLVSREAWEGVERVYQQLIELESSGVMVTYAEHILGAQAAQQRGDVVSTRRRLEEALAQWSTDLARNWLADINANFGQVTITLPQRTRAPVPIDADDMPFEPERRFAIEFAQQRLDADRSFEGYLPIGSYHIGEQAFTVASGRRAQVQVTQITHPEPVTVVEPEEPEKPEEPKEPREGSLVSGKLRLGIGYARAGSPSAGIQPASFGGMSPRVGLGMGIHPSKTIGIGLEVGWTGAFSEPGRLNLGYGMLTAEATLPTGERPTTIGLGPMFAVGIGSASGLDAEALSAYCEGRTDNACDGLSLAAENTGTVTGDIRAVGPALTASAPLFSGGSLEGGGVLMVSALSDTSRWYPVAQVGLQLSIGGRR
ncbi:MAG: hypothetical protein ACI8RZ_005865 [Myxococcota bacterium]|jgi:hypothetical protein